MKNIGLIGILKVVEDDGTVNFIAEGDYVSCYVGDSAYYIGRLVRIGYWQENDASTSTVAITIEGKSPKTVSSTNIILLSDIKQIHKMSEEDQKEVEELISKISLSSTEMNEE